MNEKDKPKMVIIFGAEAKDMTCGQKCAFAAHAAWGWERHCYSLLSHGLEPTNQYGKFNCGMFSLEIYSDWCFGGYRKIVLEADKSIEHYEHECEQAALTYYLQFTMHEKLPDGDFKPICLAVFGTDSSLRKLTENMRLMK